MQCFSTFQIRIRGDYAANNQWVVEVSLPLSEDTMLYYNNRENYH
jgi:hypothetical protein